MASRPSPSACLRALVLAAACTAPRAEQNADTLAPPPAATPIAGCYRSDQSILLGPDVPGSRQRGQGPGWLHLEAGGQARLTDRSRSTLRGTWQSVGTDSIHIIAFDDMLRVELRAAVRDREAIGTGTASSDAALERDSSGRSAELRRTWAYRATAVDCVGMPADTAAKSIG